MLYLCSIIKRDGVRLKVGALENLMKGCTMI